jgi:hypothetical protein
MLLWEIHVCETNKTHLERHEMCPICLSDFKRTQSFLHIFIQAPISNITEIRQVGAMLIYADRRRDEHADEDAV